MNKVASFHRRARTGRCAVLAMAVLAAALSGCDKCGHPSHFNAPSIQKACADDAPSAR